jgi:predicted transcriptional regulator
VNNDQLIMLLAGGSGPIGMAAIGFWIKSSLRKIDQVTTLIVKVENLNTTVTELRGEIKAISQIQKEVAVLQSNMATHWKKFDELANRIRDIRV